MVVRAAKNVKLDNAMEGGGGFLRLGREGLFTGGNRVECWQRSRGRLLQGTDSWSKDPKGKGTWHLRAEKGQVWLEHREGQGWAQRTGTFFRRLPFRSHPVVEVQSCGSPVLWFFSAGSDHGMGSSHSNSSDLTAHKAASLALIFRMLHYYCLS